MSRTTRLSSTSLTAALFSYILLHFKNTLKSTVLIDRLKPDKLVKTTDSGKLLCPNSITSILLKTCLKPGLRHVLNRSPTCRRQVRDQKSRGPGLRQDRSISTCRDRSRQKFSTKKSGTWSQTSLRQIKKSRTWSPTR